MREFAHQRIVFITSFRVHQTALKEAEDLMALGRSVEAFDKARQIPPDSVLVKQDPARFAKIRQEAVADLLNKARVAQQEGNWDRALKYAKDAADADPGSAQAEKALSLARRAKTAATRLEAAQELFDASKKLEESPAEALQLLRKALAELQEEGARPVFEGTPLESRGQGLLKDIEGRMAAVQGAKVTSSVSQLFAQGNGKAALELLEKEKDSLPASTLVLKPKILEAVRLLDAATQMDENKQFETAREAWQRLVETVADDPNEYRRRALARLQWYKENANLVAEEYRKLALAMVEDNPPAARKALNSAKGWSPENPEVLKALAELDKKAELYFRLGYALRNRAEDKEKAREHFLNVLRYAEENSDRAIQARLEMKKLED
jgi:tetratricopeptide (TPR) repeat protein